MTTPDSPAPSRKPRRLLRWALALALLGGAVWKGVHWWIDEGRHRFFPKNFGVVEEGSVYRSGQIHRGIVEDVLKEHDIRLVIDMAKDVEGDPDEAREREVAERLGIRKLNLFELDGEGLGAPSDYLTALREIVDARARGERVLVHCAGGSERTGAATAFYRMLFDGWDGRRAWDEYRSYRKRPPKNDALRDYVNQHLPELARRLQEEGRLRAIPAPLPVFGPAPGEEGR